MNERGQYGAQAAQAQDDRGSGNNTGGVLVAFGLGIGLYAFSPGARHFYKHGRLPR